MITRKDAQQSAVIAGMRGGKGSVNKISLSETNPTNVNLFAKLRLEPGASIGYHKHEGEAELIYVLSGKGTVKDDGNVYDVFPGDATTTTPGHFHDIENTGTETLEILACVIKG